MSASQQARNKQLAQETERLVAEIALLRQANLDQCEAIVRGTKERDDARSAIASMADLLNGWIHEYMGCRDSIPATVRMDLEWWWGELNGRFLATRKERDALLSWKQLHVGDTASMTGERDRALDRAEEAENEAESFAKERDMLRGGPSAVTYIGQASQAADEIHDEAIEEAAHTANGFISPVTSLIINAIRALKHRSEK